MHFIPKGIGGIDFSTQICLRFLQKQKCIKKIINFKKSNQMKKLEISQMENLQGAMRWRDCMEKGLGSVEGIFLMSAAGCFGPAGVAGALFGASIGCAL